MGENQTHQPPPGWVSETLVSQTEDLNSRHCRAQQRPVGGGKIGHSNYIRAHQIEWRVLSWVCLIRKRIRAKILMPWSFFRFCWVQMRISIGDFLDNLNTLRYPNLENKPKDMKMANMGRLLRDCSMTAHASNPGWSKICQKLSLCNYQKGESPSNSNEASGKKCDTDS